MAKMDCFLNRLDDIMHEVWKLKNDIKRCNASYVTREKTAAKLQESWNALNDAEIVVFRYERDTKNDE